MLPLRSGASGLASANFWITDSAPAGFSFTEDNALRKIGLVPPDSGTKFLEVEFPPLNDAAVAKMDPNVMMKVAGDVVVQQATNHARLNHGTEPCRIIFVLMDSKQP